MSEYLIEAIQSECNRVRKIIPHYEEIGPAGMFGKVMLQQCIRVGESGRCLNTVLVENSARTASNAGLETFSGVFLDCTILMELTHC